VHKKIKTEHHILKQFHKMLKKIAKLDEIKRIVPGRIVNTSSSRSLHNNKIARFTLSYETESGLKYMMKYGATSQECFIICSKEEKTILQAKIQKITT